MTVRPKRKDHQVSHAFAKDAANETFLVRLNEVLAPVEEAGYEPGLPEELPSLHVIGPPRSGTTLLTQLIASGLDVTCINNLTSAFWAAPVHGIKLSKHLGVTCPRKYDSKYGRTETTGEPHEFGYFWSRLLGYEEMIEPTKEEIEAVDWNRFRTVMTNMLKAADKPIVFKSFMLAWYMEEAVKTLQRTCFVRVVRDPVQNAYSILNGRKEYLASPDSWFSLKPKEYSWLKDRDVFTQVVGQVLFIESALDRLLRSVPQDNQITFSYRELCESPGACLERLAELASGHCPSVRLLETPSPFEYREYDPRRHPKIAILKKKVAAMRSSHFNNDGRDTADE